MQFERPSLDFVPSGLLKPEQVGCMAAWTLRVGRRFCEIWQADLALRLGRTLVLREPEGGGRVRLPDVK